MPINNGAAGTASSMNKSILDRYAPNTVVAVGNQQVEVLNYIAEGGFAQIYSAKYLKFLGEFENGSKAPLKVGDIACLKRVLVPDENGLSEMRNEVEVMKQLRGTKNIIQYYDSNASRRSNGQVGYEVLLLMELCPNNSLLDYMNQRLATKLSEKEVLKVMYDTTLAISQMHYLPVPLIHRDIKIENVLVDAQNNFKLCDFGSTSTCLPLVTTHQDIAILTQNIYVNTTPQYRSPEMIDLYRCLPINEKSDIWALGIFLYKLLFFITPFEMTGQFAILHSKYEFPANRYSSKLINLIIIMLAENPYVRPNIYQVMHHVCSVIGCEVPIEDKYGVGPYNFEKYTEFQTKLQNAQYQMYLLQHKKLENNGHLNNVEERLLNDLLVASFEVSSKIPVEFSIPPQQAKSRETTNSSDEFSDHMKSVFSSSKPSRNPSSASKKNLPNNEVGPELDSNLDIESKKKFESVPMAERDSHYSLQNQRSGGGVSPFSSGKSVSSGPPLQDSKTSVPLTGEHTAKSEHSPGFIKQHKSNNPFPMMAQGFSQGGQPATSLSAGVPAASPAITKVSGPIQVPTSTNSATTGLTGGVVVDPRGSISSVQLEHGNNKSEYSADNSSSVDETQFNCAHQQSQLSHAAQLSQAAQISHATQVPPATQMPQGQPRVNQNVFYQQVESQLPPSGQTQPFQFTTPPEAPQSQSYVRFNYQIPQQVQVGASPYYPSPSVGSRASLSAQKPLSQISLQQQVPSQRPRPLPTQAQAQQGFIQQEHNESTRNVHQRPATRADLVHPPENPPPIPPHPKTWQDYEIDDNLDLKQPLHRRVTSDHKSKTDPIRLERTSSKNLDLTYNRLDLNADDIMPPSRNPSRSSRKHRAFTPSSGELSTASSESIEIDLDDARKDRDRSQQLPNVMNSSTGSLRRSLDLKYQEVHFSSPEPHPQSGKESSIKDISEQSRRSAHNEIRRQSNGNINNYSVPAAIGNSPGPGSTTAGSSPSFRANDLMRCKTSRKNSSNSSIGGAPSSSATNGGGEIRRSFAKARQSLDLEKIRREALKGDQGLMGKRKSLFSVFRSSDRK